MSVKTIPVRHRQIYYNIIIKMLLPKNLKGAFYIIFVFFRQSECFYISERY